MPIHTIKAIPLGMAVSYLIKGNKNFLVDAGSEGQMNRLREGLHVAGLQLGGNRLFVDHSCPC